jgi:hypothetical protein
MSDHRPTREYLAELPVGYMDEDGRLHKEVSLRKMTGNEEALLTDRKLRANGGLLVTELLTSCVRRLGDIQPVSRSVVSHLTSADRNFLLLQLRKVTFGEELETSYVCPHCGASTLQTEDLDDLPIHRLNGSGPPLITVELEDGYEDRDEVYTTAVFRLPTGQDEEKIAAQTRENPTRGTNALLARCLKALGDMPTPRMEALGTKLIGDLTMGDRMRIEKTFRQEMPGVDLSREIDCEGCGRRFRASLDLTGFFSV